MTHLKDYINGTWKLSGKFVPKSPAYPSGGHVHPTSAMVLTSDPDFICTTSEQVKYLRFIRHILNNIYPYNTVTFSISGEFEEVRKETMNVILERILYDGGYIKNGTDRYFISELKNSTLKPYIEMEYEI